MKARVDFSELRDAVVRLGKAVKGPEAVTPLIRLTAADGGIILEAYGLIGARIRIPCEVREKGVFVTAYSGINILSVRRAGGDVSIESMGENSLLLRYRDGRANTVLTRLDTAFTQMPEPQADAKRTVLPLAAIKSMLRDIDFAKASESNMDLHNIKLQVSEDEAGVLKVSMTACNGKCFAVRTAYAMKAGDYTGSALLDPACLKAALSVLDGDDGDMEAVVDSGHVFLSYNNAKACVRTAEAKFPQLDNMIAMRKADFTAKVDKADLIGAVSCAVYLQEEARLQNEAAVLEFRDRTVSVGCETLHSYNEALDAETSGKLPGVMLFNARMLKDAASAYADDVLSFSGDGAKRPLWLCGGENGEYVYCILPIDRRPGAN